MKQASRSEKCHIVDRQTRKNYWRSHIYHVGDVIVGGEVGSIARTKLGQQISLTSFGILQKKSRNTRNHRQKILSALVQKLTFNPQAESFVQA